MRKNQSGEEEGETSSSKRLRVENGNGKSEENDEVTSTLALQQDLKAKISRNPFASRVKQPKRLIVVLEHASLETVKNNKKHSIYFNQVLFLEN